MQSAPAVEQPKKAPPGTGRSVQLSLHGKPVENNKQEKPKSKKRKLDDTHSQTKLVATASSNVVSQEPYKVLKQIASQHARETFKIERLRSLQPQAVKVG
jgi:hypothetical protein